MASEQLLLELEVLMTEFFARNTNNERKKEIEAQLNNGWLEPNAWQHCLYCISNTNNEFVAMACITALENMINRRTTVILSSHQLVIMKDSLMHTLQEKHVLMQSFVRTKLVKLVVDIARILWPHQYPTFLSDVMRLGQEESPSSPNVMLCSAFLLIISEELCVRDHQIMPHVRKMELRQLLQANASHLINFVANVLEKLLLYPPFVSTQANSHRDGTSTPPPSPSHSPSSTPPSPSSGTVSPTANELHSMLSVLEQRSQSVYETAPPWLQHAVRAMPGWDSAARNNAYAALNCLSQLLAWVPLALLTDNDARIIDMIFTYASFAASPIACGNETSTCTSYAARALESAVINNISMSALSCVQEILTRPCFPPTLTPLLLRLVQWSSILVNHLLCPLSSSFSSFSSERGQQPSISRGGSGKQALASIDSSYVEKVTELMRLLVSGHFKRLELLPHFNVEEFLAVLFRFCFSQPSFDGYLECLEVWALLLEQLLQGRVSVTEAATVRYHSALELLARGVLLKIQLRHNQRELEELEYDIIEESASTDKQGWVEYAYSWEDTVDEGEDVGDLVKEQSETQSFFSHNLDMLAKLAEYIPDKIMEMIAPDWQENCSVYLGLDRYLQRQQSDTICVSAIKLNLEQELLTPSELHCALRDLCTLLQLLGRIANTFLGPQLLPRASQATGVINRLVELGEFGQRLQLYSVETSTDILRTGLIHVHCEVLCSLRAWAHWLSQFYGHQFAVTRPITECSDAVDSSNNADDVGLSSGLTTSHPHIEPCHALTRQLLILAASPLNSEVAVTSVPWVVVRCGTQLLLSLSLLVVSPVALEVMQVQQLYSASIYSGRIPPGRVKQMLYRALVNFLLLPWPVYSNNALQQPSRSVEERQQMLHTFLHALTQPLHQPLLQQLENTRPNERAEFVQNLVNCLSFLRSQLCQLSGADRSSREIYWAGVREHLNRAYKQFMPLFVHSNVVVIGELTDVAMSCVAVVGGGGWSTEVVAEVCEWVELLIAVMRLPLYKDMALRNDQSPSAYVVTSQMHLMSLVLRDTAFVRLVGLVVKTLDELFPHVMEQASATVLRQAFFVVLRTLLEHNWKYFYKVNMQQSSAGCDDVQHEDQLSRILHAIGQSFMQTDIAVFRLNLFTLKMLNNKFRLYSKGVFRPLLSHFLTVLLQVLINGTHALLQDEIIDCIYHMAEVDMAAFVQQFLDAFLANVRVLDDQQRTQLKHDFGNDTDFPTFNLSVQRLVNDLRYYFSVSGVQNC